MNKPPVSQSYDVAISFGYKDETFATRLAGLLEGRLKVFLYSKEQEKLAGTDGEKTFNSVFGSEAKLVVILYREAWGKTPFTRFEETAIRNRAYSEGYDFTVFIPMDDDERQKVPPWVPKNRLYVGLERWGIEGAAAAIEARFHDLGGEVRVPTIEDRAAQAARGLAFNAQQQAHLSSEAGVKAQSLAFAALHSALLAAVPMLQKTVPAIQLTEKHSDLAVLYLSDAVALSVNWRWRYSNSLSGADLEVALWLGHPPWPGVWTIEKPRQTRTLSFKPALMPDGQAGWQREQEAAKSSKAVSDYVLELLLDAVTHSRS